MFNCNPGHSCATCGGCLMFPCKSTANGIHPNPNPDGKKV